MRLVRFLIIGICACIAAPALADDGPGNNLMEAGIFGGVFLPEYDHELYEDELVEHQPLKKVGFDMGLRLAYFPIPFVGVEGEGDAVYTKTRTPTEDTVFIYGLRGSLVLQVPLRITPFVFGGAGNMWMRSDDTVLGNDRDLVFH